MQAADENIGHSTRSTDFIAPHSAAERRLRDAVLALAPHAEFARRMVNSGRLSVPTVYDTPLSTPDADAVRRHGQARRAGARRAAAPRRRRGDASCSKICAANSTSSTSRTATRARPRARAVDGIALTVIGEDLIDDEGMFAQRFDATPGATYLVRPDQHLCARWRSFDAAALLRARERALQR